MEKTTKSYIEKSYNGPIFAVSSIEEVTNRIPVQVENDGKMLAFRYFDQEVIEDNGKIFAGEKTNYSNWIYFGKRCTLEDIIAEHGNDPAYEILIDNLKYTNTDVCYSQIGTYVSMDLDDITFNEYLDKFFNVKKRQK